MIGLFSKQPLVSEHTFEYFFSPEDFTLSFFVDQDWSVHFLTISRFWFDIEFVENEPLISIIQFIKMNTNNSEF